MNASPTPALLSPDPSEQTNSLLFNEATDIQETNPSHVDQHRVHSSGNADHSDVTTNHDKIRRSSLIKTEYKSNFTPFDQYVYNEITDSFVKQSTPRNTVSNNLLVETRNIPLSASSSNQDLQSDGHAQHATSAVSPALEAGVFEPVNGSDASHQHNATSEPWYMEVTRRNQKANEYRFKSELGHNSSIMTEGDVVRKSPLGNDPLIEAQILDKQHQLNSSNKFNSHEYKRDHLIAHMANNNNFKLPKDNAGSATASRRVVIDSTSSSRSLSRTTAASRARSQSSRRPVTSVAAKTDPSTKSNQTTPTRSVPSRTTNARATPRPTIVSSRTSGPPSSAASRPTTTTSRRPATASVASTRGVPTRPATTIRTARAATSTSSAKPADNKTSSSITAKPAPRVTAPSATKSPVKRSTFTTASTTNRAAASSRSTTARAAPSLPSKSTKQTSGSTTTGAIKSVKTKALADAGEKSAASVATNISSEANVKTEPQLIGLRPEADFVPIKRGDLTQTPDAPVESTRDKVGNVDYENSEPDLIFQTTENGNMLADEIAQAEKIAKEETMLREKQVEKDLDESSDLKNQLMDEERQPQMLPTATSANSSSELINGLEGGIVSAEDRFESSEHDTSLDFGTQQSDQSYAQHDQSYGHEPYSIIPTTYADQEKGARSGVDGTKETNLTGPKGDVDYSSSDNDETQRAEQHIETHGMTTRSDHDAEKTTGIHQDSEERVKESANNTSSDIGDTAAHRQHDENNQIDITPSNLAGDEGHQDEFIAGDAQITSPVEQINQTGEQDRVLLDHAPPSESAEAGEKEDLELRDDNQRDQADARDDGHLTRTKRSPSSDLEHGSNDELMKQGSETIPTQDGESCDQIETFVNDSFTGTKEKLDIDFGEGEPQQTPTLDCSQTEFGTQAVEQIKGGTVDEHDDLSGQTDVIERPSHTWEDQAAATSDHGANEIVDHSTSTDESDDEIRVHKNELLMNVAELEKIESMKKQEMSRKAELARELSESSTSLAAQHPGELLLSVDHLNEHFAQVSVRQENDDLLAQQEEQKNIDPNLTAAKNFNGTEQVEQDKSLCVVDNSQPETGEIIQQPKTDTNAESTDLLNFASITPTNESRLDLDSDIATSQPTTNLLSGQNENADAEAFDTFVVKPQSISESSRPRFSEDSSSDSGDKLDADQEGHKDSVSNLETDSNQATKSTTSAIDDEMDEDEQLKLSNHLTNSDDDVILEPRNRKDSLSEAFSPHRSVSPSRYNEGAGLGIMVQDDEEVGRVELSDGSSAEIVAPTVAENRAEVFTSKSMMPEIPQAATFINPPKFTQENDLDDDEDYNLNPLADPIDVAATMSPSSSVAEEMLRLSRQTSLANALSEADTFCELAKTTLAESKHDLVKAEMGQSDIDSKDKDEGLEHVSKETANLLKSSSSSLSSQSSMNQDLVSQTENSAHGQDGEQLDRNGVDPLNNNDINNVDTRKQNIDINSDRNNTVEQPEVEKQGQGSLAPVLADGAEFRGQAKDVDASNPLDN